MHEEALVQWLLAACLKSQSTANIYYYILAILTRKTHPSLDIWDKIFPKIILFSLTNKSHILHVNILIHGVNAFDRYLTNRG